MVSVNGCLSLYDSPVMSCQLIQSLHLRRLQLPLAVEDGWMNFLLWRMIWNVCFVIADHPTLWVQRNKHLTMVWFLTSQFNITPFIPYDLLTSHLILSYLCYGVHTSFVVFLFVETQTAAVFCAVHTLWGLLDDWSGSWSNFVKVSFQDPFVLESLIRCHALGWIPTKYTQ